ncbi:hypothetical protein WJX81_003827 [Elliptochloris bilobata]|uniref:Uncharacterized protein n=1 Tax=Elliptochloris bilobata TaxID=381761 RepID=A0AAW1RIR1_9CHLO
MFYSVQILAKKGPLGIIWIAATLDKRLKRTQVFEANIDTSVDSIINPEAPLALRLSGQLLLGVVKVYSKKVGYLYQDCNDALQKIKEAFQHGNVDLPAEGAMAPRAAITLPDNYNDTDFLGSFSVELFEPMDTPGRFTMNHRDSLMLAEDVSALASSQVSVQEERFEASGEELERHLSLGAPELLRRESGPGRSGPLFEADRLFTPGREPPDEDGERFVAPPDDMFDAADARPPSGAGDFGGELGGGGLDLGPTPGSDGGGLADLAPLPTPGDSLGARTPEVAPAPAAQRARERRRRVQLDRALAAGACKPPAADPFHVAHYSDAAADSALHRPGFSAVMAQPLYEIFARRLAAPAAAATPRGRAADPNPDPNKGPLGQGLPGEAPDGAAPMDYEAPGGHEDMGAPAYDPQPSPGQAHADAGMELSGKGGAGPGSALPSLPSAGGVFASDPASLSRSARASGRLPAPSLAGCELADHSQARDGDGAHSCFTERTRLVAAHLQESFAGGAPGKKKRRLSAGGGARVPTNSLSFGEIARGQRRADACRWFFELLVLKSRAYVELEQAEPYADITIHPRPKLMA